MQEREMAEKNKILVIKTGSHLYGTNTEKSDVDYIGIFLPDIEYVLGFRHCDEVDLSKKSKLEDGKNAPDAVDIKYYEFRKFVKLALDNNPNILEVLFVNKENIVYINEIGEKLLALKHLFPYKGLKQKFLGYAFSQKHKMVIKRDNYFNLVQAYDYLKKFSDDKYISEITISNKCPNFITTTYDEKHNTKFIVIGDLNLQPSFTISKIKDILKERINKVGNREELLLKHGYDTKFGSHLVRLMFEGKELLETNNIEFPLKERKLLLDIKRGEHPITYILELAEKLEADIETLAVSSNLRSKSAFSEIEQFTINILKEKLI